MHRLLLPLTLALAACDIPVDSALQDDQADQYAFGATTTTTSLALLCLDRRDKSCKYEDQTQFGTDSLDGLGFRPVPELLDGVMLAGLVNGKTYDFELVADTQFAEWKSGDAYTPLATIVTDFEIAAVGSGDMNEDGIDDLVFELSDGSMWAALGPVLGHYEPAKDSATVLDIYEHKDKWYGDMYRD